MSLTPLSLRLQGFPRLRTPGFHDISGLPTELVLCDRRYRAFEALLQPSGVRASASCESARGAACATILVDCSNVAGRLKRGVRNARSLSSFESERPSIRPIGASGWRLHAWSRSDTTGSRLSARKPLFEQSTSVTKRILDFLRMAAAIDA
jgi:hypothetical protein